MESVVKSVDEYLNKVTETINSLSREEVAKFVELLLKTNETGGKIFIFGNGGSAATASHLSGDFVKGLSLGQEKRFKAICLSDNSAALMAIANDICYEDIFVEQLKNFLDQGDLAVGISGSGNSENVLRAIEYAKSKGAITVGLCGFKGGKLKEVSDYVVHADVEDMEVTEDVHMAIGHCVKNVLMRIIVEK